MKKNILFIFSVIIFLDSFNATAMEPISFSKVIQADSLTKEQIFLALRTKLASVGKPIKHHIISFEDKENGILVYDDMVPYSKGGLTYLSYRGKLTFNIKIKIKDGRFKVEISNINHINDPDCTSDSRLGLITIDEKTNTGGLQKSYNNRVWKDIKEKMEIISKDIFDKCSVTAKDAKSKEEDNW